MAFHERITSYSVSVLRNDVVAYRRTIRLTTDAGTHAFLAFCDPTPADWLRFVGTSVNVFLPAADFDATYEVLRHEDPAYLTALNVIGLRAFTVDSGDEVPGLAAGDPAELAQLMTPLLKNSHERIPS